MRERTGPFRYGFQYMNRMGDHAESGVLSWGNLELPFGYFLANGGGSESFYTNPIPSTATITWEMRDWRKFPLLDVPDPPGRIKHQATAEVPRPPQGARVVYYVFVVLPDKSLKIAVLTDDELYEELKDNELARNGGPRYCLGIRAEAGVSITNTRAFFGRYMAGGDHTPREENDPGLGWMFSHGLPYPLTETVRVEWTTPDGVEHVKEVPLLTELPENVDDQCICIIIGQDEQIVVTTRPWVKWEWPNRPKWMSEAFLE